MLTELCKEIKNWFEQKKYFGNYTIDDGVIIADMEHSKPVLQEGQYFRIIGSVFNDGVWKYSKESPIGLIDEETFRGAIWALAIPKEVVDLSKEIDNWMKKYGGIDSNAMSPYNSESFGGYSYSKGGGASDSSGYNPNSWRSVFADRLKMWRKV